MSETILVAFRVRSDAVGNTKWLYCRDMSEDTQPTKGKDYDNWLSLLTTMKRILGESWKDDFETALRNGDEVTNQPVTTQQLKRFGFPNFNMSKAHPSFQNSDVDCPDS